MYVKMYMYIYTGMALLWDALLRARGWLYHRDHQSGTPIYTDICGAIYRVYRYGRSSLQFAGMPVYLHPLPHPDRCVLAHVKVEQGEV